MKLLKKAQVGGMQGFILSIVTVAVVLAVGLIVLNSLADASTADGTSTGTATNASTATRSIITKLATVPTWIGIIIIVALAFIVLSFFMGKRQ
jgi:hypothetical protein